MSNYANDERLFPFRKRKAKPENNQTREKSLKIPEAQCSFISRNAVGERKVEFIHFFVKKAILACEGQLIFFHNSTEELFGKFFFIQIAELSVNPVW